MAFIHQDLWGQILGSPTKCICSLTWFQLLDEAKVW
jgi:hypothetical protein